MKEFGEAVKDLVSDGKFLLVVAIFIFAAIGVKVGGLKWSEAGDVIKVVVAAYFGAKAVEKAAQTIANRQH
jgi:uncharacterized membrane protein YiaA